MKTREEALKLGRELQNKSQSRNRFNPFWRMGYMEGIRDYNDYLSESEQSEPKELTADDFDSVYVEINSCRGCYFDEENIKCPSWMDCFRKIYKLKEAKQ